MNTKGVILKPEFEKAILDLNFSEFTEIQEKCIPIIQAGRDLIGLSHTGSGKTAAFGFPTLEKVIPGKGIQLLVLVPTRELCSQVTKEFIKFTKYRRTAIVEITGGVAINPQIHHLARADVVVGTPGRILDHLQRGTINLSIVKILVLDEADKMFEMGFIDDLNKIISRIPKTSQKLLFGATMPAAIMNITKNYMNNPERIKMPTYVDKSKLIQHYYQIDRYNKFSLLMHALQQETEGLTIVFCSTRRGVDLVHKNLINQGVKSEALHGGLTQNRRTSVIEAFHAKKLQVLVASDVAARGLDIKNVNLIVNYDLPRTSEEYVHRIGRTARAGSEGKVISLLAEEDYDNFRKVLQDRSLLIQKLVTPEFKKLAFIAPKRPSGRPNFSHNRSGGPQRFSNSKFSRRR